MSMDACMNDEFALQHNWFHENFKHEEILKYPCIMPKQFDDFSHLENTNSIQ